jgi:outer membrane protein assembly factor BamB
MWRYNNTRSGYTTSTAPNNNHTIWTTTQIYPSSIPIVVNGMVIVTGTGPRMYALDETTGVELWRSFTFTGSPGGNPVYSNGIIYIGTTGGYLYSINATTGQKIHEATLSPDQITTSPVVANGKVFFGTYSASNNRLYAYNATTLQFIWYYGTGGPIYSSPAIAGNMLYFGCDDDKIYALDISNDLGASVVWTYTTKGNVRSTPCIAGDKLFIGSSYADDSIFALNATTTNPYGQLIWKWTGPSSIDTTPVFLNNIVYVTSYNKAYALKADAPAGNYTENDVTIKKWSATVGYYPSTPTVADGKMFFGAGDYKLYALGITDGSMIWTSTFSYTPDEPVIADGRLFVSNYYSLAAFGSYYPAQTYYYTVTPVTGLTYTIKLVIANATPSQTIETNLLATQKKMNFTITGIDITRGITNITIPNEMLGGPYTVRIDGGLPSPSPIVVTNGTHSSIYFTYAQSKHNIEITGTTAVPEFFPALMLPLLMTMYLAAAILARKKLRRN